MGVSYNKLWKLLIDRNMSKADLLKAAGVAASTFSRMNKDEYISLEVLIKNCVTLGCKMDDVVDIIHTAGICH